MTPESDVLFALLLYVSSSVGRVVPRSELLELLWPESGSASARHRLRQALYQAKKLGVSLVAPDASIVVAESDVEVDYVECVRSREALMRAVASRAIEFLPRYAPTFSLAFARWVEEERDRVRSLLRDSLSDQFVRSRSRGDHDAVVPLARAYLELDPLNSQATLALAESLAVLGSRAEALGILDRYRLEACEDDEDLARAVIGLRRRIIAVARRSSGAGPALLTGRSDAVTELNAWLASGIHGARVYAFCGEAGIGKTRLVNEGVRIATLRGTRCVEYRPSAAGNERPLAGLLDLLPQFLGLPGAVGCSEEAYSRLTTISRGYHTATSIPEDSTDSAFRFATLRRSVFDLVEAILAETDLLVSIDDAHALDRPTLELLVDATRCTGYRLALLLALRPSAELSAFLARQSDVRLVTVSPLDSAAARALVTQHLSPQAVAKQSRAIDWAVDLANGNPFFLSELSNHLGGDGGYGSLPQSVQIALERKVDALSSTSRLMVQACAVLAEHSTLDRLERMLAIPAHTMAAALAELEFAGLIALRDTRVVCRHDLIADTVLRGVTGAFGAYLHRRSALILDAELQRSPAASVAWDAASHWVAADEHGRALEVTGRIIDQLLSLGLPQEAADLCSRSEQYCRTPEQHAERLLKLSRAQRLLFDWEGVVGSLSRRRATLPGGRTRFPRYSEEEIAIFEARWWRDCDGRVLRPALLRVTDFRAPSLHRLQMAVLALIVADNQHRRSEALEIREAMESIDPVTPREDLEKAKALMVFHTAFGDLDRALREGRRVVETERATGTTAGLLKALRWLSLPLRLTNDADGAVRVLTEAFEGASRLGLRGEMWNAAFYLEGVALDCEDLPLALEWAPVVASLVGDATIHPLRRSDHNYFEARIEYMRGEYRAAQILLDRSRHLKKSLPRARGEQSVLALEVLLRVRSGASSIPNRTLARLLSLHLRSRDSGTQDFETAALLAGLLHSGRESDARAIYEYYTRIRRSRISKLPTYDAVRGQLETLGTQATY